MIEFWVNFNWYTVGFETGDWHMSDVKKNRKPTHRMNFLLLVLVALFSLTPVLATRAYAGYSNVVAYVESKLDGKTHAYYDFNEAWDDVNAWGGSLHLLEDWTTSKAITVSDGANFTLELTGHMINRNNVDPSDPKYASDSDNDGSVIIMGENSKLTINGGDTSVAHNGDSLSSGRFWHYNANGGSTIYGGLITGGATDSKCGGGGIVVKKKAELTMTDVTVAGNIADSFTWLYGYGGAIAMYGSGSKATLTNCYLMYNFADNGGGAIDVDDSDVTVTMNGGCISNNETNDYGGGIYTDNSVLELWNGSVSLELNGTTVSNNYAGEDGGGIYLEDAGTKITGGDICGNSAKDSGGGVYVKAEDCILDGCTITNNTAGERGGGVLLENDNVVYVPKLYLSGTLTIKGNTCGNARSNLFLRNSNVLYRAAKIYGTPNTSSEIWLSSEDDGVISYKADSYNDSIYHADDDNKVVYWETSASDEYCRYLKIGSASDHSQAIPAAEHVELAAPDVSPDPGSTANEGNLRPTSYDYNGYPVYTGYSMEDRREYLNAYYYSDGYFMESPSNYNEHLATFSYELARAAFNSSISADENGNDRGYTLQGCHMKQMLSDLGVAEEDIYLSDSFFVKPSADSIACGIGSKKLKNADGTDSDLTLVMVGVRGGGYGSEWASNVTLGASADGKGEHAGFAASADTLLGEVETYLKERGLDAEASQGKVRFLVTGHSRGAAVANLLSKRLIDSYEDPSMVGDDHVVFGYTFEAPQGGNAAQIREDRSYSGIHNSLLSGDVVPYVAMVSMNFQRYGVDHYLDGSAAGTASTDVVAGDGAISEGQAKRYTRKYAGWLSHAITLDSNGKLVVDEDDWKSTCFMKDNDYYEIGTEQYNARKKLMLKQLAACNDTVKFDDYFHLATLKLAASTSLTDFMEEAGSSDVTLPEFLDDFGFYANAWLIGTDALQSISAREGYTSMNSPGTYESTARTILDAGMGKKLNTETILSRIKNPFLWVYCAAWLYEDWSVDDLVDKLDFFGVIGEDSVPLSKAQAKAALNLAGNVINSDYGFVKEYFAGTSVNYGCDEKCFVMTGTLLYNVKRILNNHNQDVVLAWTRSADSFYTDEANEANTTLYTLKSATADELDKPYLTMKVNGKEVTLEAGESCNLYDYDTTAVPTVTDVKLHTSSRNTGSMVFYTYGDGSGVEYEEYSYYDASSAVLFDENTDWRQVQQLTANSTWYNTSSGNTTFTIYYQRDANIHDVYVNGEAVGAYGTGTQVEIALTAPDDCHEFAGCGYDTEKSTGRTPEGWDVVTGEDGQLKLTFTMPAGDAYWDVTFKQKRVEAPVASPDATEFTTDQYIAFSTPSGTEGEGFTVSYSYRAYTVGTSSSKEISAEGTGGLVIYAIDGDDTVWIVTAVAEREGWEGSSRQFILHVSPSQGTYTVSARNATLAGGESHGTFKPGDTVTVTATNDVVEGWECSVDGLISSDSTEKTVTFTMPTRDVDIAAILRVEKPTASIVPGSYTGAQKVELSCATGGATIRYTTDGAEPDENSAIYEGVIKVTNNVTIKARAYCEGMGASDVAEFGYAINHTVTFDHGEAGGSTSAAVADGATVGKPTDPVFDGHVFVGWLTEDGKTYDFSTPVTGDLTLRASWRVSKDEPHGDDTPGKNDGASGGDKGGANGGANGGTGGGDSGASGGADAGGSASAGGSADASGSALPANGDASVAPAGLLAAGTACVAAAVMLRRHRS